MWTPAPFAFLPEVLISCLSARHGVGLDGLSGINGQIPTSGGWPAVNYAFYFPMYIDRPGLVTKFWTLNGTTATGNVDIGLYRKDYTRVISKGSTAQAGTSVIQEFDITDTWITRGVYFLGLAESSTGTFFRTGLASAAYSGQVMGITQEAAALPLPATATPVALSSTFPIPVAGIAFRALVA